MKDDSDLPQRKIIRLPYYDYASAGLYFITICTHDRLCLLGRIVNEGMECNAAGRMVAETWKNLPQFIAGIEMDEFVVMPNHVHGIVWIRPPDESKNGVGVAFHRHPDEGDGKQSGQRRSAAPTGLFNIMNRFKTFTTHEYRKMTGQHHLWQRNYYEHVIRNDDDLRRTREYIANNPLQWALDKENPDYIPPSK